MPSRPATWASCAGLSMKEGGSRDILPEGAVLPITVAPKIKMAPRWTGEGEDGQATVAVVRAAEGRHLDADHADK